MQTDGKSTKQYIVHIVHNPTDRYPYGMKVAFTDMVKAVEFFNRATENYKNTKTTITKEIIGE